MKIRNVMCTDVDRYFISSETSLTGDVVSVLNMSAVTAEDGGRYTCRAHNERGHAHHSARLNIYGTVYFLHTFSPKSTPPFLLRVTPVPGALTNLLCCILIFYRSAIDPSARPGTGGGRCQCHHLLPLRWISDQVHRGAF